MGGRLQIGIEAEQCRRRGREDEAVHTVEKAAMTRNEHARVLDAGPALQSRLGKIPCLRNDREEESRERQAQMRSACDEEGIESTDERSGRNAADETGPGLVRRYAWLQTGACDAAPPELGKRIGCAHHEQEEQDRGESVWFIGPNPEQRDRRN